ncbi:unnamed protein product [Mytilus coruscus]|uniref:Uncharacterized protein n=1 Tax=Mytilus coruscus TaxID=42192 RepID=A0A6J8A4T9_MYTCO|nr:unnamed protein product [Mytilus coruscus]
MNSNVCKKSTTTKNYESETDLKTVIKKINNRSEKFEKVLRDTKVLSDTQVLRNTQVLECNCITEEAIKEAIEDKAETDVLHFIEKSDLFAMDDETKERISGILPVFYRLPPDVAAFYRQVLQIILAVIRPPPDPLLDIRHRICDGQIQTWDGKDVFLP